MKSKIKDIMSRIKQSKDGKNVIANFGYLSLLQIAGYAFPLITLPYLARVLGAEGVGKIAFATSLMIWVQTIADWGFNLTATRDVAQHRTDKDKVSRIFSNVFWARCFLSLFAGIILAIAVVSIPYLKENSLIIFISYMLVPGHIMFPDWFFQAVEKMKYTTILNLTIKFIFTIAVFLFIHDKEDFIVQPLLSTIGYVACGMIAFYLILFKWGYKMYRPQWSEIIRTINESADVFVNNLMHNFYFSFSTILVGFWGGAVANGIYEGGNKFPTIFVNLQNVLSRAFYPFLSRKLDKHHMFSVVSMTTTIIGVVVLIVASPLLVKIMLGHEFLQSIPLMRIFCLSIIFLSMYNIYGQNYLLINKNEKSLRNITILSSLIGMMSSIPLIYYYSYTGAALTILITRGLLGVLCFIKAKSISSTKIARK